MEKKFKGIIIDLRRYQENSFLVGLLTQDSIYLRAWLKSETLQVKHYAGQVITGRLHEFQNRYFLKIDSNEDDYLNFFWDDFEKLDYLRKILNQIALLPQNVEIPDLYTEFLSFVKTLLRSNEEALQKWDDFYKKLQD